MFTHTDPSSRSVASDLAGAQQSSHSLGTHFGSRDTLWVRLLQRLKEPTYSYGGSSRGANLPWTVGNRLKKKDVRPTEDNLLKALHFRTMILKIFIY